MDDLRLSSVYSYQNYRMCVAGNYREYRYLVACPSGKLIVRSGFTKMLEASRAAQREAVLLSIKDP